METNEASNTVVRVLAALVTIALGNGHAAEGSERLWQCSSHGHERAIELYERGDERREGEPSCWVVYTKDGASEVLWQAKNNADYCRPKALSLVARLESAGFACTASDPDNTPAKRPENTTTATDDSDMLMPPLAVGAGSDEPAATETDLRKLLSKHYEENYLDAMMAALPSGFSVRPDMDAISPGPMEYLHPGPPEHFVKTLSDGSYVLVNTLLFERGATSFYVNLGFQVKNKRYRFLGYATTQPVTEFEVLDADTESVALSVRPITAADCTPARRTQVMAWHGELSGHDPQEGNPSISGDDECGNSAP